MKKNKNNQNYRYIIKNDACQFDLQQTFNQLSMFTLNPPQIPTPQKQTLPPITLPPINIPINKSQTNNDKKQNKDQEKESKDNLVDVLADIKGLKNTLRYIKLNQMVQHVKKELTMTKKQNQNNNSQVPIDKQVFVRPTQAVLNGPTTFWLTRGVKESSKQRLNLDSPTFVMTFNSSIPNVYDGQQLLVAIERKCLTLYQVDQQEIHLKDFDSVSLQKKLNVIDVKHTQYEGKNYVLIFGNQKQKKQDFLRCMVYQIKNQRFLFVKKANLWKGQVYSPTILFENYPKNQKEKYCLIVGGCRDGKNVMFYQALQIDIHLLVTSWLTYPIELTKQVPFDTKRQTILSGKAIKYNDFWYIFCTENQTITQIKMDYQHGIWLETLHLSTNSLELKEKIYFSENNIFLTLKSSLKLIMLNANLEFKEKDFMQMIQKFQHH